MQIAPRGIRLPHFDECAWNRPRIFIQDSPADDDSFAQRLATVLPRKIAGLHIDGFFSK
jgi:hypothetical protein